MSLIENLENVVDPDTFLVFVKALIEDRDKDDAEIRRKKKLNIYDPIWDNSEWESVTIAAYLEGATAWAEARKEERLPQKPTWRTFAEILYAGKFYE